MCIRDRPSTSRSALCIRCVALWLRTVFARRSPSTRATKVSPTSSSPSTTRPWWPCTAACTFTVVDGVIPGNEGRGYVLRRIARRAIRHGYKLGARKPFFHALVAPLADEMGDAYPELRRDRARATDVLKQEEERFFQTIANGMEILEAALAAARACSRWRAIAALKPASSTATPRSRQTSAVRSSGKPKVSCSLKAVLPLKTVALPPCMAASSPSRMLMPLSLITHLTLPTSDLV